MDEYQIDNRNKLYYISKRD